MRTSGFNGYLVLPPDLIVRLQLMCVGRGRGLLADGTVAWMDVHRADVERDGAFVSVYALSGTGRTLVGVSLLYGYVLTFEAVDGGQVIIEKL